MSTTDHAFIRAFGHQQVTASPTTHSHEVSGQSAEKETWRHESTGERIWVARVPDASHTPTPPSTAAPNRDSRPLDWHEAMDRQFIRWDPASDTVMPPSAHFRLAPASSKAAPATNHPVGADFSPSTGASLETTPASPSAAPTSRMLLPSDFQPQWEVDHLRWPPVCDRLQRTSHHRLSEIVTSLLATPHRGPRVIGITSFGRREGRTTLALALARLASGANARVALVDGDVEHADIAQQIGIAFEQGWESWNTHAPLGEAAVLSIREQFVVLPLGQRQQLVSEPVLLDRAEQMVRILRTNLDLVLVDTGPMYIAAHRWFRTGQPLGFDAALVIRDVRHAEPDQVDDVCCRLIHAGIPDAAIIENFQDQA